MKRLVESSAGGRVVIEIKGIDDVNRMLRNKSILLTKQAEITVAQAAAHLVTEVQMSIIGQRSELKSVRTGRLANSIEANAVDKSTYVISPRYEFYEDNETSTLDVAKILEYGTATLLPRRHFSNTKVREESFVQKLVKGAVLKII